MNATDTNADSRELHKFDALASRWWDPAGEFRPLHELNPLRTAFIAERADLDGARALDVGCGGGILTESLATLGAEVTGIDMAPGPLGVARMHQQRSGLASIRYLECSAESLAETEAGTFDVVTCMEVLEHVPDPARLVAACAALARPGGRLFFATLNRTPKAFALAIVGAEYMLNLLPRGTHEFLKFIKPSELRRWGIAAGLEFDDVRGVSYGPLSRTFSVGHDVDVNYMMSMRKPA